MTEKEKVLKILRLLSEHRFPVLPYDPDRSLERNVFQSGEASAIKGIVLMVDRHDSLDDLLSDLTERYQPQKEN